MYSSKSAQTYRHRVWAVGGQGLEASRVSEVSALKRNITETRGPGHAAKTGLQPRQSVEIRTALAIEFLLCGHTQTCICIYQCVYIQMYIHCGHTCEYHMCVSVCVCVEKHIHYFCKIAYISGHSSHTFRLKVYKFYSKTMHFCPKVYALLDKSTYTFTKSVYTFAKSVYTFC